MMRCTCMRLIPSCLLEPTYLLCSMYYDLVRRFHLVCSSLTTILLSGIEKSIHRLLPILTQLLVLPQAALISRTVTRAV